MKKTVVIVVLLSVALITVYFLYSKGLLKIGKMCKLKYFDINEFDSGVTQSQINKGVESYTNRGKLRQKDSALNNMECSFLAKLENARDIIEKSWNAEHPDKKIVFVINNGYRNTEYNKKVGGVKNSAHLIGRASDIATGSYSSEQKKQILKALYKAGFRRFGIGSHFIHVDNANNSTGHSTPAVWTYGDDNALVTNINQIENIV